MPFFEVKFRIICHWQSITDEENVMRSSSFVSVIISSDSHYGPIMTSSMQPLNQSNGSILGDNDVAQQSCGIISLNDAHTVSLLYCGDQH